MYLSRLILNLRHRQVRTDLARPYEFHRTLLRAFPDHLAAGEERLLFRLETDPRRAEPVALVQSQLLPAWEQLPADYLADALDDVNPAVKSYDLALQAGRTLSFRLVANPTKRLSRSLSKGLEKSKRVGLYKQEEQLDWLARKGEQHGFRVLAATVGRQDRSEDSSHQITLLSVQFDGLLGVTEPDRLTAAVMDGIGSAKAFGCGLLSLAPARL